MTSDDQTRNRCSEQMFSSKARKLPKKDRQNLSLRFRPLTGNGLHFYGLDFAALENEKVRPLTGNGLHFYNKKDSAGRRIRIVSSPYGEWIAFLPLIKWAFQRKPLKILSLQVKKVYMLFSIFAILL